MSGPVTAEKDGPDVQDDDPEFIIRCYECDFTTRDGYLAGEHEDATGHRTDGEE